VLISFSVTRRQWVIAIIIAIGVLIPIGIVAAARIPFSSDTLRHRLIDTLQDRLNADVELNTLTLRFHPRLHAVGTGLTLRHKGHRDLPPLISVDTFTVDADLVGLWHRRVAHVKLDGLRIQIPPDDDQPTSDTAPSASAAIDQPAPDQAGAYLKQVVINEVEAPDAVLVVMRRDPTKPARTWSLHQLRLNEVGANSRMPFDTVLTNALPPGEIQASGRFGPWQPEDPGRTPLDGAFTFDHADLSVFDGISGMLSATGAFQGTLDQLDITGQTDTPDFMVTLSGHKLRLATTYHALVDATNGNTTLDPIHATFLNTSVTAKGGVYEVKGDKGRVIKLDVAIDEGRLEDIMQLAVKTPRAPMTGRLHLTTKFVIPPGRRDIVDKLQLDGQFTIQGGRFTNADVQKKVNELSQRASARAADLLPAKAIGSNFTGRFRLGDSRLAIPAVAKSDR